MKKILLFLPILLLLSAVSCVNDKTSTTHSTNPHIEEFYFNEHAKIAGIEDVKFTVDTIACVIYNEDSVSFGCDLSRVLPVPVSFQSLNSIKVNNEKWNYRDTLDMTNPITISTISGNKKRTAEYVVTVNQHKVEPDSIIWNKNIINESNITSINSSNHNNLVYLFLSKNNGETKIYTISENNTSAQVFSTTELKLNFFASIVHNEKCFVVSSDNSTLYYLSLDNLNNGFSPIALPEGMQIIDLCGIINGKLFAILKAESPIYMSFDGTEWKEENCNMLNELTAVGSAKINNDNTLFIISGELNGKLTNNVLATQDGNYWINTINQADTLLFEPFKNACVVDYYSYIYTLGGITKDGNVATSYYSRNDGYSWNPLKSCQRPANNFSAKENITATTLGDYIFMFNCSNTSTIESWRGKINRADFIKKK